ncbi:MAG: hypothetical protein HPY57_14605 [Ignavibacteria bacterium]|nr:hypothetical protein [Ignavibacteria bacterium]
MTYKRFDKLIQSFKNQFVIYTKDGRILFLRPRPYYNPAAVLATNEKTFELEIIEYEDIDYVIVDGQKYK